MYRAIGLAALQKGIDPMDEQAVSKLIAAGQVQVDVRFADGRQQTYWMVSR